ncbi:S8 family serine peptidase [Nocardia mangyaensis]|uniref:S8 family serine peptidase n=1 Tax=Nocardia mangyaensis TaxID=2213200 RepID=UPI002675D19C|nr:S8 family serine peptidase [Nocardia mangyaensis]MDO3646435.1 S8 family serine peptidase [Nocardia mangyaensis]
MVVEAAGNGGENLDDAVYSARLEGFPARWRNPFDGADFGAVLVGAGAPPPGLHGRDHGPARSRLAFSNHGARLDAQGWGREVTTTGYGDLQGGADEDLWYTDEFSGTSSASPIVVGAVAAYQGIRANDTGRAGPAQIRALLRATGSAQTAAPGRPATERIGALPDLRAVLGRG